MECDETQLNISRLTDGELPDDLSAEVFSHLVSCRECRGFYNSLQRMNTALAVEALEEQTMEAGMPPFRERYVKARGGRKSDRWLHRRLEISLPVFGSMILLLGALIVTLMLGAPGARSTETIYVTKMPAVIVTSEHETIHTLN